jgi:hypothetical protein
VAWWSLAFLGPFLGAAARPHTSTRILFLMTGTLGSVLLIGSQVAPAAQPFLLSILAMLIHAWTHVALISGPETGGEQPAGSHVDVVIALAVFVAPAVLLLWLGFLSKLPLYWRRC